MRPSDVVVARKGFDGPSGRIRVRETSRNGAGRPVVRSRTWQVIGSRCGFGAGWGVRTAAVVVFIMSSLFCVFVKPEST